MKVGVFTALLSQLPLDEVLKTACSLSKKGSGKQLSY